MSQSLKCIFSTIAVCLLSACASGGGGGDVYGPAQAPSPLLDPSALAMNLTAPDTFKVLLETTAGDIVLEVQRDLAPLGADRFYSLVRNGYYDDIFFFRNIGGFMAQFGIHGDPDVSSAWRSARIQDDSVRASNVRGAISFAMAGPNTRTVQLFINHGNNARLDAMGFAPFGRVTGGMDTVDRLYNGYGEGAPQGRGPSQDRIMSEGNEYLRREFPLLDSIVRARILDDAVDD